MIRGVVFEPDIFEFDAMFNVGREVIFSCLIVFGKGHKGFIVFDEEIVLVDIIQLADQTGYGTNKTTDGRAGNLGSTEGDGLIDG